MASTNRSSGAQEPALFTAIFHPIRSTILAAVLFCILVVVTMLVDVMMFGRDAAAGLQALSHMTQVALDYTRVNGEMTLTTEWAARSAIAVSDAFERFFGFRQGLDNLADGRPVPLMELGYQRIVTEHLGAVLIGLQSIKLLVVRLVLVVASLPLLMTAVVLGTIDGLSARAVRRAGAGRESSLLYHRAKRMHLYGLVALTAAFVVAPVSIDPALIFLPYAILAALLSHIQWRFYKKYL
ncbi:DUF4400 domain-containing protein [Burkholderia glumae]|uniref:DUF4400 domain-containing protein n=1 Tax=Burkholderia glumae TaxID=337 RepID=UPI0020CC4EBF|nr:DUF4400 domain-containing protein [Burkholderia glumae]MCQ0031492.1 DUF4400 domain-containing protein [Burkholderia glumae]MCQ0035144.1 DUF4400 domain-containing protein [Burkholderia glumae]MCR1769791.1 DUF4400 domain-containing protein [Burkholderia glumae]